MRPKRPTGEPLSELGVLATDGEPSDGKSLRPMIAHDQVVAIVARVLYHDRC